MNPHELQVEDLPLRENEPEYDKPNQLVKPPCRDKEPQSVSTTFVTQKPDRGG